MTAALEQYLPQAVLRPVGSPQLETDIAHCDGQRDAVAHAILAGRQDRARRAMKQHRDDTAAILRGLVG